MGNTTCELDIHAVFCCRFGTSTHVLLTELVRSDLFQHRCCSRQVPASGQKAFMHDPNINSTCDSIPERHIQQSMLSTTWLGLEARACRKYIAARSDDGQTLSMPPSSSDTRWRSRSQFRQYESNSSSSSLPKNSSCEMAALQVPMNSLRASRHANETDSDASTTRRQEVGWGGLLRRYQWLVGKGGYLGSQTMSLQTTACIHSGAQRA